ncbi:hypothetical protein H0H81_004345 [Sphagnurus paluster]|uniref:Dystroglycan-type cadherin-like domain-containing protein n=1 Tax=Sphagnurus paluster TaxID=117069 RepID=A0A9P7KHF8_9AGAR|nr:hypothetical protein H0H81_004345 [Sphagnurus paluster]
MLIPLFAVLALPVTVYSSRLAVVLPPDSQLPLIARVGKPYSWKLSENTFGPTTSALTYATSPLPPWLAFDPGSLNFRGTPSTEDEGYPQITITAKDSSSTVSSTFTLFVTSFPEPTLNLSIAQQFSAPAPSLSSVFILAPHSGIVTQNPSVRIPLGWSFSVGFEYETFLSERLVYYEARQRDGSALPEWMVFNSNAITVNGVVPKQMAINQPVVMPLSLYASDEEGYSSACVPFDFVLADHEISLATPSLPTINITTATSFTFTLSSPADFSGVLIDGKAIQPEDIMTLVIDTSQYNWLKYDHGSRTLSGDPGENTFPPGQSPPLLATITTTFNQSIRAPIFLALVPSYFSTCAIPPIQATPGDPIQFNLRQDYSNATEHDDAHLTAAFEPSEAGGYFRFDSDTGELTGTIPSGFSGSRITVTFTAYSRVTHSTSHSSLPIVLAPPENTKKGFHPTGLSKVAHGRLVLGLGITFGVVGGLCVFGGLLAIIRRCARPQDTAIGDEEGRGVWSEQDKKWYGIGVQQSRGRDWTKRDPNFTEKPGPSMNHHASHNAHDGIQEKYRNLGLGLRRVSERSQSESNGNDELSPRAVTKREFFKRLKETVRVVSDRAQGRKSSQGRPVIGKPILPAHNVYQIQHEAPLGSSSTFDEPLPSHLGSMMMTNSPSSSTEQSIPRRRADFAPPRLPGQVHFDDGLSRQPSSGSTSSNSLDVHGEEAIVQTASIRSGRSASGRSFMAEPPAVAGTRPRLVPFTSASRVPKPLPASSPPGLPQGESPSKRVVSQKAKVWKSNQKDTVATGGSSDEIVVSFHYNDSYGADQPNSANEG